MSEKLHEEEDDTAGYFETSHRQDNGSSNQLSGSHHKNVSKSFADASAVEVDRAGKLRREVALPLRFVVNQVKLELDSADLYADMKVFIPFLILFIFFFLAGRDVESNYYVIQGVKNAFFSGLYPSEQTQLLTYQQQILNGQRIWIELDKNYAGIGNNGDWPGWFSLVMIPNLWDCVNADTGYSFNARQGQNYLLGALRVRTQRVTDYSCDIRSEFYPHNASLVSEKCYGPISSSEKTDPYLCNYTNPATGERMYKYRDCADVPGAPTSAAEGLYHCGGYIIEMPFNTSCNVAQQFATIFQDTTQCEELLNQHNSRFIMTEFFMYTPSTNAFHSIKFFTEIIGPGWWYNEWLMRSFTVWSSSDIVQTLVDIAFLIYVLYYWFMYFYLMVVHVRRDDKSVLSYIFDFWNVFELVNLVTFLVVFGFRFSWYAVSYSAQSTLKLPMDPVYPPYLDKLQVLYEGMIYANSINTIFVFLKVLKYVRLNPRLNVLTRTISEAQQSLVGVIVLFFTIVLGYAITGWTLFGVNVERYRNLGVSISSVVRQLVGDIDYDSIKQENRFLAGLFFWSYMILALFLLLNFIIAIISESFAKVSGKAYSTPFEELLVRWLQSMRSFLRPSNIKRMFSNAISGKSEAKLLRKVLASMEEQYALRYDALVELRRQRLLKQAQEFRSSGKFDFADMLPDEDEEDEDDEELQVYIRFDDLPLLMDTDVYEDLTEHFWMYTWEKLMNDHDDAKKTSEEVSKRRMAETVQVGVQKVLGDDLSKIDLLDEALKSVEDEVEKLLYAVAN